MTKSEIINDYKFRLRCGKYGLDWTNFEIYGDVILLNTPKYNLYILFDKNYNTIAIESYDSLLHLHETKESFAKRKYYEYCNFTDILPFGENFGYPFEDFTLKHIVDLSSRIEIMESNHGHTISTKINGDWYDAKEHDDYFQLLSYIKFIGEEVKQYFLYVYHMNMIGFEVPDVYSYVRALISKVNEFVTFYNENNINPKPCDILSYIGQNHRELRFDGILYDVIDLLTRNANNKDTKEIENNLSAKSSKLLKFTEEKSRVEEIAKLNQEMQRELASFSAFMKADLESETEQSNPENGLAYSKKKEN